MTEVAYIDRPSRALYYYAILYLGFLYIPVLFLPMFSFNDNIICNCFQRGLHSRQWGT